MENRNDKTLRHQGLTTMVVFPANDNRLTSTRTPDDFSPATGCRPVRFLTVTAVSTNVVAANDNSLPDAVAA